MEEDLAIAQRIIEHIENTDATGEWAWINRNRRSAYMGALAEKKPKNFADCLSHMFTNGAAYRILHSNAEFL